MWERFINSLASTGASVLILFVLTVVVLAMTSYGFPSRILDIILGALLALLTGSIQKHD